jgi:hypothetical protein
MTAAVPLEWNYDGVVLKRLFLARNLVTPEEPSRANEGDDCHPRIEQREGAVSRCWDARQHHGPRGIPGI